MHRFTSLEPKAHKSTCFLTPINHYKPAPTPYAYLGPDVTDYADNIENLLTKIISRIEQRNTETIRQINDYKTKQVSLVNPIPQKDGTRLSTPVDNTDASTLVDKGNTLCNLTLNSAIGKRCTAFIDDDLQGYQQSALSSQQNLAKAWQTAAYKFFKKNGIDINNASSGSAQMVITKVINEMTIDEQERLYAHYITKNTRDHLWNKAATQEFCRDVAEHQKKATKAYKQSATNWVCERLTEEIYDQFIQQKDYAKSVEKNPGSIETVWNNHLAGLQLAINSN